MSQTMWKARTHPQCCPFTTCTYYGTWKFHTYAHVHIHIKHTKIIFKRSLPGRISLLPHFLSMLLVYSLIYSAFCFTAPSFISVVPHLSAYFISSSKSNSSFSYTRASSCAFCFHSLCVLFYTTVMKSRRLGHVAFKV